jgi:hypothetical protein
VLWLLFPYTKGSWTLYNKFVPLFRHEQENDKIIATAKELRFRNMLNLCTKLAKYPCINNMVCWLKCCSRSFSIVIRFAGVSYGRFVAMCYKFNLVMYIQGPLVVDRRGGTERDLNKITAGSRYRTLA